MLPPIPISAAERGVPAKTSAPAKRDMGFTLVELLAVIAIIAILATLVLASLSSFMKSADEAKFVSNLRAVSGAVHGIASDNDGKLPPFLDKNIGASTMWQFKAAAYLSEPPSDLRADILRSTLHDPGDKSINPILKRPTRNVAINGHANMVDAPPAGATDRRLSSIKRPSKLALLCPGGSASLTTEWGTGAKFLSWEVKSHKEPLENYSRYGKFMHFAFVDGHVEKLTWESVQAELDLVPSGRSVLFDSLANNAGQ